MRLENEEKRWLIKALGYLGGFAAFGLLGHGLLGFLFGLVVWGVSFLAIDRLGFGKENDRA